MRNPDFYLLFDHVKIQAANAISSPLTYGFPALSGFVGAIHALNRTLLPKPIAFGGVMIACHHYELQTYQNSPYADSTFNQTRNPLKKNGETASIIEEGKIHLDVSLVVEISIADDSLSSALENPESEETKAFLNECKQRLWQQRIAGGSVLNIENVALFQINHTQEIKQTLTPAFVLMDAKDTLKEITEQLRTGLTEDNMEILPANPNATALDALLEIATLHHIPQSENADTHEWETWNIKQQGYGWLVPIPVGYQAISPQFNAGEMKHCRTNAYPSQYVETVYSLGKWVFPSHLPKEDLSPCFWRHNAFEDNLYLITQGA